MGGRGASSGRAGGGKQDAMNSYDRLSADEKEALDYYTMDGYDINDILRNNDELSDMNKMLKKDLDSALSKSELKQDEVFYRGVDASAFGVNVAGTNSFDNSEEIAKQLKSKIGQKFTDAGYLSTTKDVSIANSFMVSRTNGIRLEITAKKGSKGIYLADKSKTLTEKEFLFKRNSSLKITDVMSGYGTVVVKCELTN